VYIKKHRLRLARACCTRMHISRNDGTYQQGSHMESEVLKELRLIRQDLKYIRAHMVDQDMILSPEEKVLLDESRLELQTGKTRSLDDVTRARNGA
jgi:hypothetical protein